MTDTSQQFTDLALPAELLRAVSEVGYETPSPIQAQTIPALLDGRDVLGHAPTGTGKTAAFALPLLANLDPAQRQVQALVLTPTRELAIQVSEAITRYAAYYPRIQVLPVYGGQDYSHQTRMLRKGVQVVVGTPGRLMDHLRRGVLSLADLKLLVLDEADEMLRMGFIDDVEWILEQAPPKRQMALFSATMPPPIRTITRRHLNNPAEITVKASEKSAANIHQHVWMVSGMHKLDALTRILEAETFDGMLVFVRTRNATLELAEKLNARGFTTSALNGDLAQKQREHIVERLRQGKLDILVATDVVARGLDVERISHVINYDMPHDVESYIHRIGRTGRAGRSGDAILFATPRERRLLRAIEKATGGEMTSYDMPSIARVNDKRVQGFKASIDNALAADSPKIRQSLDKLQHLISEHAREQAIPVERIAAALAQMSLGDEPLLLSDEKKHKKPTKPAHADSPSEPPKRRRDKNKDAMRFDRYRVEVGSDHGAQASNIVGAIANEAGIEPRYIGRIKVHTEYSEVELPEGMPKPILRMLKQVWVCNRKLAMRQVSGDAAATSEHKNTPPPGHQKRNRNERDGRDGALSHNTHKKNKRSKQGHTHKSAQSARTDQSAKPFKQSGKTRSAAKSGKGHKS